MCIYLAKQRKVLITDILRKVGGHPDLFVSHKTNTGVLNNNNNSYGTAYVPLV